MDHKRKQRCNNSNQNKNSHKPRSFFQKKAKKM